MYKLSWWQKIEGVWTLESKIIPEGENYEIHLPKGVDLDSITIEEIKE